MIHHFVDFIRTKYGTNDFIPLHKPKFLGKEKAFLSECIDEAEVSSYGRFIDSFEDSMAKVTKTNKALSLVNGTAALQVALKLAGVKQGHEVITQGLTFVATANAISYNGAHPVVCRVGCYSTIETLMEQTKMVRHSVTEQHPYQEVSLPTHV